jgi:hypothetical protein
MFALAASILDAPPTGRGMLVGGAGLVLGGAARF